VSSTAPTPTRTPADVFGDSGNTDLWVQQVKQILPPSQIVMLYFFQPYAP
jgi:hypothetical protein